jgi:hypothetical protein
MEARSPIGFGFGPSFGPCRGQSLRLNGYAINGLTKVAWHRAAINSSPSPPGTYLPCGSSPTGYERGEQDGAESWRFSAEPGGLIRMRAVL